jgi:hypothetical protein
MPQMLSLDALIEAELSEEFDRDPDGNYANYIVMGLEAQPEERTNKGWYDGRARDLVDLFNA